MSRPDGPWVHEMVLVHRVFRRELGLAPTLVTAVAPHDRRAAARVGAHLRFVLDGLQVHHSGEDELLWPCWPSGPRSEAVSSTGCSPNTLRSPPTSTASVASWSAGR
jgi:hypothetical protein